MKTKPIIAAILSALMLAGCAQAVKEPVDYRVIPAHDTVRTKYEYCFDIFKGDFVLVPEISTVYIPDEYQVKNKYTYEDGTIYYRWESCTEEEYKNVKEGKLCEN